MKLFYVFKSTYFVSVKRTHNKVFSFSQAVPRLSSTLLACWLALPPIPQCLLAGFAPNPPRTSFHSESRTNKLALNTFPLNVKKRGNPTYVKSRIAPNLIWPLCSVFVFQLVSPVPRSEGIGRYCTSPFDNLSSPGVPAGIQNMSFSSL